MDNIVRYVRLQQSAPFNSVYQGVPLRPVATSGAYILSVKVTVRDGLWPNNWHELHSRAGVITCPSSSQWFHIVTAASADSYVPAPRTTTAAAAAAATLIVAAAAVAAATTSGSPFPPYGPQYSISVIW